MTLRSFVVIALPAVAAAFFTLLGCTDQHRTPFLANSGTASAPRANVLVLDGAEFIVPPEALRVASDHGFVVEVEVPDLVASEPRSSGVVRVQAHLSKPRQVASAEYLLAVRGSRQPSGGRGRIELPSAFGLRYLAGPASYDREKIAPPPPRYDFSDEFVPRGSTTTPDQAGFIVCTSESYRASDASLRQAALLCEDSSLYQDFYLELQYSRSLLPEWKRIRAAVVAALSTWQKSSGQQR
jgi:hypothetical protein